MDYYIYTIIFTVPQARHVSYSRCSRRNIRIQMSK